MLRQAQCQECPRGRNVPKATHRIVDAAGHAHHVCDKHAAWVRAALREKEMPPCPR